MQPEKQKNLWNRSYIMMLLLSILTSVGFNMVHPIVVKYAISLGASVAISGTIAGIFAISALVGRPFSGFIADKFNKKKIYIIATMLLALATLGYGISTNPTMLLVFRMFHGLAFSISGTASMALGATFIPKDRLGEGIGFLGIGFIIARALGPNLGIIISNRFGYPYVFFGAFIIVAMAALFMLLLKYEHTPRESGQNFSIKFSDMIAKELLPLIIIASSFSVMNGMISSFLVTLGDEKKIAGIGIYFTVNAAVLFLIRPFAGKLLDKKGLAFIVFPAFVLGIGTAILLWTANTLWMVIAAAVLYAVGQGAAQPAFQTSCIKKLGPDRVGVATSTYYIGADVANGVGPMIGGAIAGIYGYSSVYFLGMLILFIGLLGFYFYQQKAAVSQTAT